MTIIGSNTPTLVDIARMTEAEVARDGADRAREFVESSQWFVAWADPPVILNPNWHQRLRIRARRYVDRVADAWAVLRGDKVALTEDEAYF